MSKPAFCICEIKGADQVRDNRAADQHFCFRFIDSAILLLPKFDISSHSHFFVDVTDMIDDKCFIVTRLIQFVWRLRWSHELKISQATQDSAGAGLEYDLSRIETKPVVRLCIHIYESVIIL